MKKTITTLGLLFVLNIAFAQKWTFVEVNSNVTRYAEDVDFVDANNGLIVGQAGMIKRTTDGGKTWDSIGSGTTNTLSEVFYQNAERVWAVGHEIVLKSSDGGLTWVGSFNDLPFNTRLSDVQFLNDNVGYVCGTQVYKTTNGGKNWNVLSTGNAYKHSLHFLTDSLGYVCGNSGTVAKTEVGDSFYVQNVPVPGDMYKIRFMNDSVGVAVGTSGIIFHTIDRGSTWSLRSAASTSSYISVAYAGNNTWWCGGTDSEVATSTDGGASWHSVAFPNSGEEIRDLFLLNDTLGWFVTKSGLYIFENIVAASIASKSNLPTAKPYPNPCTGIVRLDNIIGQNQIEVCDVMGNILLHNNTLFAGEPIDISHFANGTYLLKITDNQGETQNIRIQKLN